MLGISLRKGETAQVIFRNHNLDFEIRLLEIKDGKTRVGFEAPQEVNIVRTEALEKHFGNLTTGSKK